MEVKPITGRFVLSAPDGKWTYDDKDELVFLATKTVYFESSVGEGRAKYWTNNLKEAHVFTDMSKAIAMLVETNRAHSPVTVLRVE